VKYFAWYVIIIFQEAKITKANGVKKKKRTGYSKNKTVFLPSFEKHKFVPLQFNSLSI